MPSSSIEQDLDDVRRAAFELRETDPNEAVRILRRLAKKGGEVEPLVHGALAEILLDDFDDVDGALHHFRRLLVLAPDLAAGELGLARALSRNGEQKAAQDHYVRALAGLEALARAAKAGEGGEDTAGADETVLTSLELAVEEREMCRESGVGTPRTAPATELIEWAESARLFDDPDEPDDIDDWIRFAQLRSTLTALDGHLEAALADIERIGRLVSIPAPLQARIRSLVFEAARELPKAADEAMTFLAAENTPFDPDWMLRTAALLSVTERGREARQVLESLRNRAKTEKDLPKEIRTELIEVATEHLKELDAEGLVSLGVGLRGRS